MKAGLTRDVEQKHEPEHWYWPALFWLVWVVAALGFITVFGGIEWFGTGGYTGPPY